VIHPAEQKAAVDALLAGGSTNQKIIYANLNPAAGKSDEQMRVVALNNDRDQYGVVLQQKAESMIVDRHEANGQLFNAFFEKPGFRDALMRYLAESYDEIRDEDAS
jgi:type I restriction enzyme R subunit